MIPPTPEMFGEYSLAILLIISATITVLVIGMLLGRKRHRRPHNEE